MSGTTIRDDLMEQIDWRLDHEVQSALGRALNADAHRPRMAAQCWRDLANELRALADLADEVAASPSDGCC